MAHPGWFYISGFSVTILAGFRTALAFHALGRTDVTLVTLLLPARTSGSVVRPALPALHLGDGVTLRVLADGRSGPLYERYTPVHTGSGSQNTDTGSR